MTDYGFPRGKTIDAAGGPVLRGVGLVFGLIVIFILLFASMAQVPTDPPVPDS